MSSPQISIKSPKACQKAGKMLKEFCDTTSIHGLKYITEENSHWLKRAMWTLVFLGGILFSGYFCWQMWNKWEDSPVLMSLDSNRYPLKNIPFPAVTICNVNKVSKTKLLQFMEDPRYKDVTYEKMQETLRYMTKLDRAITNEKELEYLNGYYEALNISSLDLFEILRESAPSCKDMIMDCIWLGLPSPCFDYFSFVPTDDGICCTFNGAKYDDLELNIKSNENERLHVSGNGYRMGLALVLDANIEDYSVTNGKFDGFKVLVHTSEEFPDVADRGFVVGPGSETFVGVKGITTFNTEEVAKGVTPNKRQCQVEGEQTLKYFPQYSRSACTVECATRLMQDRCKCRPYFFRADRGTKLCDLASYSCISDAYEDVRQKEEVFCNCLPPCTDVWYDPEISYATFPGRGFNLTRTFKRLVAGLNLSSTTDSNEYFKSNVAVLHVYYKDKTGVRYKTDIRFGVEDFISAMGGLLGLGLGLSFISVFELFYFLCLRFIFPSSKTLFRNREQEMNCNSFPPGNKKNVWYPTCTAETA
ncbi:putative amiloride-sensitive sodium channel [Daphnia sinensis]|uniref:Amiloride-sensitive sodium channel n=1 Tax=Daphnia sinensis TaxID=1820382 RepID=A0AAD5KYU5_9CRUS|nr:putative amiloride-sensitive sodium channel [Daphnia sinensis]